MNVIEITRVDDQRLDHYCRLTEAQLRNRLDPEQGIFIAESPKVIKLALDTGCLPISLLCERKHISGDAKEIIERIGDIPIYTGDRAVLAALTGYALTRGVLCAMRRPQLPSPSQICAGARRIAVIDGVVDTTNIGAIFRSAAALDIDGVVLTPESCDPLNRRAVRVSMGTIFQVPWTWISAPAELKQFGFRLAAMALNENSISVDNPILKAEKRLAIILGTEGDGLSERVISDADYVVRIPMRQGVDSLNVAAASAVAFWEMRPQ